MGYPGHACIHIEANIIIDQPISPTPPVFTQTPVEPESPKKTYKWLIVAVVVFCLSSAAIFAYKYYQLKKQLVQPQLTLTASPSPTATTEEKKTEEKNNSAINNWKTFTSQTLEVTFKYPGAWQILVSQDSYVRVVADKVNQLGDFLSIETQTGKTLEEAKDWAVHYYAFSTAGLGDQDPKIIFQQDITFLNLKAFKYIYQLNRPYSPQSNQVTQILVPKNGNVVDIKLQSSSQDLINLILSTFKFTGQEMSYCSPSYAVEKDTPELTASQNYANECLSKKNKDDCLSVDFYNKIAGDFTSPDGIPDCLWSNQ